VSYNWTAGSASTGPNQNGLPLAQIYGVKRGVWDMSASYTLESLPMKPQITLNVLNLGNSKSRSYFWHTNMVNDTYNPGRSITLGVRGTF
jgi:outer membrane receptor protein involved in Fe transport